MEEAEHGQNETQSQTEISFQVSQSNVVSQTHTSFPKTSKLTARKRTLRSNKTIKCTQSRNNTVGQQQQLAFKPPRKAPSSTPTSSAPGETPSSSRHPSPAPRPDGEKKLSKERLEAIDEKNKSIRYKVVEGSLLEVYKSFEATMGVESNGEDKTVTWILEYEKKSETVLPDPHTLMDMCVVMTKDIERHHLS
ncbi:Kirola [Sesamum alatum]|uniref:Kirola n=1 Tax=Sesamum alatum TaxID=300844 RepID=A0AAE2CIH7_9LAMI|nr:Kirola [Sesamum alatum]